MGGDRRLRIAVAATALQVLASAFFIADSAQEVLFGHHREAAGGFNWLEVGVALALLLGIMLGARLTRRLFNEARDRERLIATARGALSRVIAARFAEWRLSPAEADVALFALKGCSISEIAALRNSAVGTVRAQLSQVYGKAGVSSQTMLVALFIEELLGTD